MTIRELADLLPSNIAVDTFGDILRDVESLSYDSRQVFPGVLFVCLKGERTDGHAYRDQAIARGAIGFVIDRDRISDFQSGTLPFIAVDDTRKTLPYLAKAFYHDPSATFDLIGVTGTNGKTTTTYMISAILQQSGGKTGVIGTVGAQIDGKPFPTHWTVSTTPESLDLQQFFAQMRDEHVEHVAIEVTSIAIDQERTAACAFDTAVFTNLTQDHLDYHGTMEAYQEAKGRLFSEYLSYASKQGKPISAVLNVDDPAGTVYADLAKTSGAKTLCYAIENQTADLIAVNIEARADSTDFVVLESNSEAYPIHLNVGGLFNVSNALAAIATARLREVPVEAIQLGLSTLAGVPGRFEPVETGSRGFHVLVDYAHTPDGLENVLKSARVLKPKRLVVIFGCGGNRDRTKRPKMGKIAVDLADLVIVTSDNPRKEDPDFIVSEILTGFDGGADNPKVIVEVDRRKAIFLTLLKEALPGDLIVIAGKGHETYQIVGEETFPFDDREVAREALAG